MTSPTTCPHQRFKADCDMGRLSDVEGGPITGYTVSMRINCVDCGMPFRFIGIPAGNHYAEPRVSIDGEQLHAPLEPAEHQKFQLQANYVMKPSARQ